MEDWMALLACWNCCGPDLQYLTGMSMDIIKQKEKNGFEQGFLRDALILYGRMTRLSVQEVS